MAPSPQHGTRVRASSAARRKAARSCGDSGPARREISCSTSSERVVDIDGLAWDKSAVFSLFCCQMTFGPLHPGGPLLSRPDLEFLATVDYAKGARDVKISLRCP